MPILKLAVVALAVASFSTGVGAEIVLLHNCDSAAGARLTWGTGVAGKSLTVVTDEAFVSEGTGSLHLSGRATGEQVRPYLGVMIPVPATDLCNRTVLVDLWTSTPETTHALYLRLYNDKGEKVGSWSNWSSPFTGGPRQTFKFHRGISSPGFSFEPRVVGNRTPDAVTAVELIIGTRSRSERFDLYVDNLRYDTERLPSLQTLTAPKKLYPQTTLVEDGKPAALIVRPADPVYASLAQSVAEAVRKRTGVTLRIVTTAPARPDRNLVLLGQLNNNPAIAPLYGFNYCAVDAVYPGAGGYVIRTIHDPWGAAKNAVLLGGSDAEGVRRAVAAFTLRLKLHGKALLVPPTFQLKPGEELRKQMPWLTSPPPKDYVEKQRAAAKDALAAGRHTGLFGMIAMQGERYLATGFAPYARAFVELVQRAYRHYLTKPKTYGGPWGMDSDFMAYRVFPAWDVVEECPAVTEPERLEVTKILGRWIEEAVAPKTPGLNPAARVRFNHQTFPSLGCFFAGSYFAKYYKVLESDRWLALARNCFDVQAETFKSMEDCNGYQWLTLGHTIHYALSSGDFRYFETGNAAREADYCILCMDNFGYQVPYGDTGSFKCWFTEIPFLRRAAWYYDVHGTKEQRQWAAGYQWALMKKAEVTNVVRLNEYARTLTARPPTRLLGVQAWPVDPTYYDTMKADPRPPVEKCVDKVVMRAAFAVDKQYLLLDGLSNGGHKHYDGNTIPRLTDRGRIWLADNDYYKAQPKFHNGVLIFKDGQSQQIPAYCELEGVGSLPGFGFSRTVVRDYAGVDWHRTILWAKERYFLVVDEMEANEPSDYSFRTKWYTLGEPSLTEAGLEVEQQGVRFFFKHGAPARLKLEDDKDLGANWRGYEYAKPVVRAFTQITDMKLSAGQSAVLPTLLYGSDEARPATFEIARLPFQTFAISDAVDTVWVDPRVVRPEKPNEGLRITAQASLAGSRRLVAFGLESVWRGKRMLLATTAPVDLELSLTNGNGTLVAAQDCELTWNWGRLTLDGKSTNGKAKVAAGTHHLTLAGESRQSFAKAVAARLASARRPPSLPAPTLKVRDPKPLKTLWSFRETYSEYLLTGNEGAAEAVDVGAKITASPAPRAHNWFGGDSNEVSNLVDGVVDSTDGCVQWDDDQTVTVTVVFAERYALSHLTLKEWWANASSKGKKFQLDRAVLQLSDDGFRTDVRTVGEIVDRRPHGNWGAPGHEPVAYEFKDLNRKARALRLILTPKKGTAIYLAELEVWGRGENLNAKRRRDLPVHTFSSLFAAAVDGHGRQDVVAGSTNGAVYVIDGDGRVRWKARTGGPVYAVTAADLDGDGRMEVLAGGADQRVHCFTADGTPRWEHELPRYKSPAVIRVLFTAKLTPGDQRAVIAGADNWRYYALDATGKELWHYESVHRSTAGTAVDINGDDLQEVFCGTEYYWWTCVNPDGSRAWSYSTRTGPKANAVAAGDIDGDGNEEVLVGGADANVHALDDNGKLLWQYNTGDEVTGVCCVDLEGDGRTEILVGSQSFNLYALKGDGTRLWRTSLGDRVTALCRTGLPGAPLVAGTDAGGVFLVDPDGLLLRTANVGAPVKNLVVAGTGANGMRSVVVATTTGILEALKLPSPPDNHTKTTDRRPPVLEGHTGSRSGASASG